MSKADRTMKACGKGQKKPAKFESPFGPKQSSVKRFSLNGQVR